MGRHVAGTLSVRDGAPMDIVGFREGETMSQAAAFSPDYTAARARFRSSALALGCALEEHAIDERGPDGEDLTIDLARLGSDAPRKVVIVSSGLHGVEGFLGSAVQAALLEDHLGGWTPPEGCTLLLLHALNPYGFAWIRRVDQQNVDLNRNFLLPGEPWEGAPDMYPELDEFFNPRRRPNPLEPFTLRAVAKILQHGMASLKETLPVGQYEFPEGLFYGGSGPSRTMQILDANLPRWIGEAGQILHVDFHTGQGKWGEYILAANHESADPRVDWLREVFGDKVEAWDPAATLYTIRGGLGTWCAHKFPERIYDELTAEFGTYHTIRVVDALRDENMAHHYCDPGDSARARAKAQLKETFAPAETRWRERCVEQGLQVVQQAIEACFG